MHAVTVDMMTKEEADLLIDMFYNYIARIYDSFNQQQFKSFSQKNHTWWMQYVRVTTVLKVSCV